MGRLPLKVNGGQRTLMDIWGSGSTENRENEDVSSFATFSISQGSKQRKCSFGTVYNRSVDVYGSDLHQRLLYETLRRCDVLASCRSPHSRSSVSVTSVQFDSQGCLFTACSSDGSLRIFDFDRTSRKSKEGWKFEEACRVSGDLAATRAKWNPSNESQLVTITSSKNCIDLIDLQKSRCKPVLKLQAKSSALNNQLGELKDVCFVQSPQGSNRLVAAGDRGGTVKLWDLRANKGRSIFEWKSFKYHGASEVSSVLPSRDGINLISVHQEGLVQVFDMRFSGQIMLQDVMNHPSISKERWEFVLYAEMYGDDRMMVQMTDSTVVSVDLSSMETSTAFTVQDGNDRYFAPIRRFFSSTAQNISAIGCRNDIKFFDTTALCSMNTFLPKPILSLDSLESQTSVTAMHPFLPFLIRGTDSNEIQLIGPIEQKETV